MGRDSSVGIATGYGLDGPGIESRTCPDRPWGPPSLLYNGYRISPAVKEQLGHDADPSLPSSAVVKNGRAIPLLPLWPIRPVQSLSACTRVHFTFIYTISCHLSTHIRVIKIRALYFRDRIYPKLVSIT